MKQNRMSRREDLRAHLDLQINLLAEREMTVVLQMLQKISTRLGIQTPGDEIEELTEETPVEALASEFNTNCKKNKRKRVRGGIHMQVISHCKHAVNITQTERIMSAIGGGLLAAAGLQRRGAAGAAMAVLGGDLLRRAITGHSHAYEALGIRTAPKGQGAETTSVPYD